VSAYPHPGGSFSTNERTGDILWRTLRVIILPKRDHISNFKFFSRRTCRICLDLPYTDIPATFIHFGPWMFVRNQSMWRLERRQSMRIRGVVNLRFLQRFWSHVSVLWMTETWSLRWMYSPEKQRTGSVGWSWSGSWLSMSVLYVAQFPKVA